MSELNRFIALVLSGGTEPLPLRRISSMAAGRHLTEVCWTQQEFIHEP
jgi:hypothetical protein